MPNWSNLQSQLVVVFGIVLIIVGIRMAFSSKKDSYQDTTRTGFNVVIAVVIAVIGIGAVAWQTIGKSVAAAIGFGG